jgi:hypothetical protein
VLQSAQKGYDMLETYVLSLLAIWLTITIIGQLTGAYLGFDLIQKIKKM